jgi:hypothetical protein
MADSLRDHGVVLDLTGRKFVTELRAEGVTTSLILCKTINAENTPANNVVAFARAIAA